MCDKLCRGKRKDNGEWVYGFAIFADNKAFILNNAKVEFVKGFNENRLNFVLIEVIPETVGQYTGLTDKNGKDKKIFNGDIVKHTQEYEISGIVKSIGVVKWSDSYGGWIISSFTNGRADMFLANEKNRVEVIGNIHDNPELLKEG